MTQTTHPVPKDRPLIHIGFHKTGTTLLQWNVFSRADLGFRRPREQGTRIHTDYVLFGPYDDPAPDEIARLRAELTETPERLVISHERLSGYPASGGFDSAAIARRLSAIYPEARILIGVRSQPDMVRSYYSQYITDGGVRSFASLSHDPEPKLRRMPVFDMDFFAYHKAVARYQALFGAENVMVYPFEEMQRDSLGLVQRIIDFAHGPDHGYTVTPAILEAPVNSGIPPTLQAIRRVANALLTRNHLSPTGLMNLRGLEYGFRKIKPAFGVFGPIDRLLEARIRRQVSAACTGRFEASNAELARLTGLDLRRYGYPLPPDA